MQTKLNACIVLQSVALPGGGIALHWPAEQNAK